MLPGAPNSRFRRERKGIKGRTAEIQRLIGRSLRAVIDLTKFPQYQIILDCDVLQADGGTRTAAITGACIAAYDAFQTMLQKNMIAEMPLKQWVAAVSVGIVQGKPVVDLDYAADSTADVDMNVVMTEDGKFVEIQGTAEAAPFDAEELKVMLEHAKEAISQLISEQKASVDLQ
jgi:ribonuclease PH